MPKILISSTNRSIFVTCILTAFVGLLLLNGCKNKDLIRPGDSISVAFKKAMRSYRKEKYTQASKSFQTVITSGRGTNYARSAHFFLAQSYYLDGQYLLASNAYNQFISLYPQDVKVEKASYKEALCYYKLSPRYNIDQKYTKQAIDKFRIFISRYPKSDKVDQAGKYISEMRTKLAHKYYGAAQLYARLDEYKSAALYYELVIDQYPGASWAEQALVNEIQTYNEYAHKSIKSSKRKRYNKAIKVYEKYLQLFPNGAHRSQAEAEVDNAREGLASLGPASPKNQQGSAN